MKFLSNSWYCAGFSHDVGDKPAAVRILNQPIVMFRGSDGRIKALQDRCAHRFAPLSMGKVCGDSIQCPYHGLQYGADGACSFNPWGNGVPPKAAQVRSYPVVERNLILWIWMGDSSAPPKEDALDLGDFFNHPQHSVVWGSYVLQAHYEIVTDNLLDLSHAVFLHSGSLSNGPEEVNRMRAEMRQEGNCVVALHRRDGVQPAPIFKKAWNGRSPTVNHRSDMHWHPAANLLHDVGVTAPGEPQGRNDGVYLHVAHLLTPISERETHYHWIAARNFGLDSEEASTALFNAINHAFTQEDEPMIAAVQDRMGTTNLKSLSPVMLPGDAAAWRARRITDNLRRMEAGEKEAA